MEDNFDPFNKGLLDKFLYKNNNDIFNRIAGLIYGIAIAECFGVQVDNMTKDEIEERYNNGVLEMPTIQSHGVKPNDWGGNTDQLIIVINTLIDNDLDFNVLSFVKKIKKWRRDGFQELGDITSTGMDQTTNRVISNDEFIKNPFNVSCKVARELNCNSNGCIVRGAIMGICNKWPTKTVQQAMITHANSLSVYSSWLLTDICRDLIKNCLFDANKYFKKKLIFIKKNYAKYFNKYQAIYESTDCQSQLNDLKLGNGYKQTHSLKSIGCAFYALNILRKNKDKKNIFKETIQTIVNQGGDTDTNAAITGAVLGSYLMYSNLPSDWLAHLENKQWLDRKILLLFDCYTKRISTTTKE